MNSVIFFVNNLECILCEVGMCDVVCGFVFAK